MPTRSSLSPLATSVVLAAALLAGLAATAEAQTVKGNFVPCLSTSWTPARCGADPLTNGTFVVNNLGGMSVNVTGLNVFNLYEVHWLPIGLAETSAIYVGAFGTDCNGDANGPLRTIGTPANVVSGATTNFVALVGAASAGNFLIYSRGPWGWNDANSDCKPDDLNTVPLGSPATFPLANPSVVLGSTLVQFIPGYK
jgi:hypothetical protein